MEAKDTVMNPHDAIDTYNHFREKYEEEQEALEMPVLQSQADNVGINAHSLAQAQISFKAGRESFLDDAGNATIPLSEACQKGRREVVEFVEAQNLSFANYILRIPSEQWESKKKEWGI